jgi:hypothetical protein
MQKTARSSLCLMQVDAPFLPKSGERWACLVARLVACPVGLSGGLSGDLSGDLSGPAVAERICACWTVLGSVRQCLLEIAVLKLSA